MGHHQAITTQSRTMPRTAMSQKRVLDAKRSTFPRGATLIQKCWQRKLTWTQIPSLAAVYHAATSNTLSLTRFTSCTGRRGPSVDVDPLAIGTRIASRIQKLRLTRIGWVKLALGRWNNYCIQRGLSLQPAPVSIRVQRRVVPINSFSARVSQVRRQEYPHQYICAWLSCS